MSLLSVLFPSAFPALALAHFVALLSPGPDFFLLVGYAARYRMRGSAGLCVRQRAVYSAGNYRLGDPAPASPVVYGY